MVILRPVALTISLVICSGLAHSAPFHFKPAQSPANDHLLLTQSTAPPAEVPEQEARGQKPWRQKP